MRQFLITIKGKAHSVTQHDDGTFELPPELRQVQGVGSGLKPSWEPILLFRKPLDGTLGNNVLTHGTGGLNIDATRVRHASKADFEAHKAGVDAIKEKGGSRDKSWKNSSDLCGANEVQEGGRWPANVLLEHTPACRCLGSTQVRGSHAAVAKGEPPVSKGTYRTTDRVYGSYAPKPTTSHVGLDGLEVTEAWKCAEGCPVRELNEQSGDRPSTLTGRADPESSHKHPGTEMNPNSAFLGERTHLSRVYADQGGAARFFTQFEGQGTEWECVDGCPVKVLAEQGVASGHHPNGHRGTAVDHTDRENRVYGRLNALTRCPDLHGDSGTVSRFFSQFDGVPFKYVPKANRKEAGCGEFEVQHITLKPLSLIRWLVKLVTRKGGVVLDLYCGSGTTPHAAVLEGMQYVAIERDSVNHAEAVRRLEIVLQQDQERRDAEELHEFAMGRG